MSKHNIPSKLHLAPNLMAVDIVTEPTRKGFGRGLKKAGEADQRVVALCADLTESTQISLFAEAFPDRYVEIGIAEQNLVTTASGLAAMGKVPFCSSYAAFSPGRNWEQIRTTIALNERPVKIVGSHAGISVGPDGATHQMLEDIALMRVLPNMVVVVPGDSLEAEKATLELAKDDIRPAYLRLAREATPIMTTNKTPFAIGPAYIYREGTDLTIVATGTMTYQALVAADTLAKEGIHAEVVHVPTIKPLDTETILASIRKTGAVLTAEEAQINAGLGGLIAELVGENHPVPLKRIGMQDRFGESGKPNELADYFGLTAPYLVQAAKDLIARKQ